MTAEKSFLECVKVVLGRLNKLQGHSSLHLTSIAKAIEHNNRKITKIIFHELVGKGLDKKGHAMLLTQKLSTKSEFDQINANLYEHFIFYDTKDIRPIQVRFAIAHELGHILLQNPMNIDKIDRRRVPIEGCDSLFAVKYKPEDEIEADIFATIMCEQREIPKRELLFKPPCIKYIQDYKEKEFYRPETLESLNNGVKTCVELFFS